YRQAAGLARVPPPRAPGPVHGRSAGPLGTRVAPLERPCYGAMTRAPRPRCPPGSSPRARRRMIHANGRRQRDVVPGPAVLVTPALGLGLDRPRSGLDRAARLRLR